MAQHKHGQGILLKYLEPRGERKKGIGHCGMNFPFTLLFLFLTSSNTFLHSRVSVKDSLDTSLITWDSYFWFNFVWTDFFVIDYLISYTLRILLHYCFIGDSVYTLQFVPNLWHILASSLMLQAWCSRKAPLYRVYPFTNKIVMKQYW